MKNLQRFCSLIVALAPALALLTVRGRTAASPAATYRAYVGTYTAKTDSKGIYEFDFDPATGKMSAVGLAGDSKDPSWVVVHANRKYLYSVNEAGKESTVSAFAIDPGGKLILLNQLPSLGEDPCYLSFDRTGKYLFVANYSSGNVAVFPILADGKLGEHTGLQQDSGTLGPNKERQEAPHAHWVTDSGGAVFVADLGLDRVMVYQFDPSKGTLGAMPASGPSAPYPQASLQLSPGTGPRHAAFSPSGRFIYVLGELDSTVSGFATTKEGVFNGSLGKYHMLPAGFSARNDAAEIAIHPNGKFLYASNRGRDSIVVYSIAEDGGRLTQVADVPTGGKEPRHFAIDPTGHFLLAENQLSGTIVEFRIDPASGKLTPTGATLSVPSPVCIAFLAVQ